MSSSSNHQNKEIKSQTKKILAIDTLRGYAIDSENREYKNVSKIDGFSNGENILENHDRYLKYINGSLEKRYDCIVICCSDSNLALEKQIKDLCLKIFPTSKIYVIGSRAPLFTHWFSKLNNKPNFGELIAVSRIKYLDPNKTGMVCGLFTRSKSDEGEDEILVQIDGINIQTNDFKDLDVLIKNKMPIYSPANPNTNIIYVAVYPEGYQFKDQKLVTKNFCHKDTDRAKGALLFGKNKMNENVQNYIEIKEHQDANVKVTKVVKESQLSSSVKSSTKLVNIQNVNNELQQQHHQQLKHCFAIDIGTTSCRAALIYTDKNGKEKCEKVNLKGENEKMPSIVNFCENQTYKGCEAEENHANSSDTKINSENTVYDITHFLGKNINEISENRFQHFKAEENRDFIKIKIPNGLILPEVACGELLKYIAQEADAKLKAETKSIVTHVTLTTPILNDEMKIKYETALKCAAQLASLKVIEFIDAPTAVLVDYIFTYKKLTIVNFNICVIDIGGGTTDIVAYNVESDGKEFRLKPLFKYGNSKFNGRNFDVALAEKIESIIVKKHGHAVNIGDNFSILSNAEKMKIELSNETSAKYFYTQDKKVQSASISREDFENCIQPFIESFKKDLTNINQKFEENDQNNEVLLLGNTCKIPIVRKTIRDIFSNSKIIEAFHNEISFAKGAAIHTAKIQQSNDNQISVYKY